MASPVSQPYKAVLCLMYPINQMETTLDQFGLHVKRIIACRLYITAYNLDVDLVLMTVVAFLDTG